MEAVNDQTFMKTKPIAGLVLSMSLPMVLSMLVNSLYNIVDSYFVAKISEEAMTAISLVYPLQNLVNAAAIGFGVGSCAAISFYLGADRKNKADEAASLGYVLSFAHGVFLGLLCIVIIGGFLKLFTDADDVIELGMQYAGIVFLFSPVVNMGMHAEKVLQAAGRMTDTMLCMLAGCIFNIIMDPVLIFGLGPFPQMGIKGAALATGLGQLTAFLLYAAAGVIKPLPVDIKLKPYMSLTVIRKELHGSESTSLRMYSVGIPASLNLALPSILISSLNAILAAWSQSYVMVLGVYYKLQTFLYLPANGIIQGIRPIVGYNYGAGEYKRVKQVSCLTLILCAAIMAVGMFLCLMIPDKIMALFTENAETVAEGAHALRIICFGFIASAFSVTVSGVLEGIGNGKQSLVISMCRYIVIIIPTAFVISRILGADGVWHAFWITEIITALVTLKLKPF